MSFIFLMTSELQMAFLLTLFDGYTLNSYIDVASIHVHIYYPEFCSLAGEV